jgi:Ca-activated chloride channel family protein
MEIDKSDMPVSNLVFLLDVSGSMASPDKLPLVQKAMRLLVNNLPANNRIAIVVYAGASGTVLPSTPLSEKETILEAIDDLYAGGSTAGSEGIKLAYKVAKEDFIDGGNNRVILATDGDFNVGTTSDGELVRLIEQKREDGIFLSVLGFGTGNIKDSKMEQLADKGNGNYAYIDNILEAQKVLVSEMGGTLVTIAKDVKIQVEFNPAEVKAYRLIGYENRLLNDEDFNDDTKDAGEIGAGASVTALYELVTDEEELKKVSKVDALKYQKTTPTDEASSSGELLTVKVRYKKPTGNTSKLLSTPVNKDSHVAFDDASADFRFATSVAAFGMLLRGSDHLGTANYDKVIAWAKDGRGSDDKGYRNEFIRLADLARSL